MNEITWLNGRVKKHALPIYQGSPDPGAPAQKRLLLPQGELAQIYDDQQPIRYMALIELKAGTQRGNHFHRVKEEHIYVLAGEFQLLLEDVDTKHREIGKILAGDLVFIPPNIAHTLQITQSGQAIEFAPSRFDASDIYRYVIQ